MVRKPAVPLLPIKDLSPEQAAKRRLARKLGLGNEKRLDAFIKRNRALPEDDIRHIRPGIRDDDFKALNRIKRNQSRYKTPTARLLEKKRILVDSADENVKHWSAFTFLEKYLAMILALLKDPKTTQYQKRQLRALLQELQDAIKHSGDLGEPRQFDLWNRYQGRDLGV